VDKPPGPTSHDVVVRARRALQTRAVGHCGTLDPFASGLLVLLVGRATRLARFVEAQAKRYEATARLGVTTSTDDLTGEVVRVSDAGPPSAEAVRKALEGLRGPQRQRAPVFSAKRVKGERSYARARRGEPVEAPESDVVVFSIAFQSYHYPELRFGAVVGPGTYLRSLARDLGERLGCGAHLTALRRLAIGRLEVANAVTPDAITPERLLSPLQVLAHLPALELDEAGVRAVGHGRSVAQAGGAPGHLALTHDGELVAVAEGDGTVARPVVVLASA
jgi:tRNA pseudouridine55 synthase